MRNIVIIGGGTGTFTLLSGLRKFPTNNSVIVSTADDGGSTGRLREALGVVPPGDIRQCLVGLSYTDKTLRDLFSYRFASGELAGHTVGNIFIAALEKSAGSIEKAIIEAAKLLNVRGQVVPVTLFPTTLSAIYSNGKKVVGEHNIDEPPPHPPLSRQGRGIKGEGSKIQKLFLKPDNPANPRALRLIKQADAIIFGPGDLYTSTIPNLLVKGIASAIKNSRAKKILITNLMTKHGQTNRYKSSDFARALEKYIGKIDIAIVNTKKPASPWLARYKKEKAEFVEPDIQGLKRSGIKVVAQSLISSNIFQKNSADKLKRSFLRHDSDKIAKIIWGLH